MVGLLIGGTKLSKETSPLPHVSPNDWVATIAPLLSIKNRVAKDKRHKQPLGSDEDPHQRFRIVTDSTRNSFPKSTFHQTGLPLAATFVCEKVLFLPSTARLAPKLLRVDDWLDDFLVATLMPVEYTCTSNKLMFSPVASSILMVDAGYDCL